MTITLVGLAGILASTIPAQCYHLGSTPIAGVWTESPLPLGCAEAPAWPMWHLFTPPHRAPIEHVGYNPGDARAIPALLIRYRCTGFALLPVVPDHVRKMGYVIDRAEIQCE